MEGGLGDIGNEVYLTHLRGLHCTEQYAGNLANCRQPVEVEGESPTLFTSSLRSWGSFPLWSAEVARAQRSSCGGAI